MKAETVVKTAKEHLTSAEDELKHDEEENCWFHLRQLQNYLVGVFMGMDSVDEDTPSKITAPKGVIT